MPPCSDREARENSIWWRRGESDYSAVLSRFNLLIFQIALFYRDAQFAANWNKRLMGLNHIKLKDAVVVGALTLLSAHPAVPFVFTVWFGLALTNYHYDAIFKYSMLALGLQIWIHFFGLLHEVSLKDAFATVGHLNSIAMLVILVTTIWMSLENLQKNLNENTLKAFKWFNVGCALFYGVVYFIRG